MKPRLLVATTVHHPDDNRIREKTVRSLAGDFEITYAARSPGPSDTSGLQWLPLSGGRLRRNLVLWRRAFAGRFDVVSIHDPELLPLGLALSVLGRSAVVFDVHEDVPAQIRTKTWLPAWSRRPIAAIARLALRLAERTMTLSLAEQSYATSLERSHPVVSNYPETADLPYSSDGQGVIYVGSVTEARGLVDAVVACGRIDVPLTVVGPFDRHIESSMRSAAVRCGTDLTMTGRLPHGEAMARVAEAAVALSPLHDIPNYRQSIPTKVLEYLAIGVPVAASDLPATRTLVEGLAAVELFEPGNAEALADAVGRLLRPDVGVLARAQADQVRERFRWPAEELRQIYLAVSR